MPTGVLGQVTTSVLGGPVSVPTAKVRPPQVRDSEVPRSDALKRVVAADARVLVVSAPAGFGKTTFVGQWARLGGRPVAWATLDSTDSDPVVLISTLLAALDGSGVHLPALAGVLTGDEPAFSRRVLNEFRCVVEAFEEPVTVVVDDLHAAQDPRHGAILTGLVESLPAGCRIALVSRTELDLPVARWRAAGLVEFVGQEDLAFDASELAAMLEVVTGQPPVWADAVSCLQRTSGWPVAAYLDAAFGPHAASATVTAANLGAYLNSEVLAGVPGELVPFLRDTAVLTLLDGPSCDAVLDSVGSHEQLIRAARSTLLISPVREVSGAFRLHPLIREHLAARLAEEDPDRAAELHGRAAVWLADAGYADEAIRHALASHDADLVGRLVWAASVPSLTYGRITRVAAWLDQVGEPMIFNSVELAMTATWTAVAQGAPASAVRWAVATMDLLGPDWATHLDRSTVEPSMALLLAVQGMGDYQLAVRTAAAARSALPIDSAMRPLGRLIEGLCLTLSGDIRGGSVAMTEALSLAQAMNLGTTWVEAASLLAFVKAATGRWVAADVHIRIARQAWVSHDLDDFASSTAILMPVSAWMHAREGHLDQARLDLERAEARLDDVVPTLTWLGPLSLALIARTQSLLGDAEAAARAAAKAAMSQAELPSSKLLEDFIASTNRELEQRSPLASLTPAERRVWDLLARGFSRHEMAEALFVSEDTVKTHLSSIYRKVGVNNRRAAMRLAEEIAGGTYRQAQDASD